MRYASGFCCISPTGLAPNGLGPKGAARRRAQTYGVRIRCRIRRAPSGAPQALLVRYRASRLSAGCVAQLERMLISRRLPTAGPAFRCRRVGAGLSASSWQGLLLVPGGAPMPPECRVATLPAGAAPRPASWRPMSAPFIGRGGAMIRKDSDAGISRGFLMLRSGRRPRLEAWAPFEMRASLAPQGEGFLVCAFSVLDFGLRRSTGDGNSAPKMTSFPPPS
jgi:hypothetical protein